MTHHSLYERACQSIPGGVNSPVRSFRSTGLEPIFIKKADRQFVYTEENRKLTDFCCSWGALILGHNSPEVRISLKKSIPNGTSYGLCHKAEAEIAELIRRLMPSIQKIRFVNSGTEAVLSAIRLARAFTKRSIVVKFDGCYHGHSDSMLVSAGSGVNEIHSSSSAGITGNQVRETLSIPYNDTEALEYLIDTKGKEIACVIIEPVAGNMGLVLPEPGYLEALRKITSENGIILIFDEVISGFRAGLHGAQGLFGIVPDLTTLGKIIGGGLPVGAFGGRADIMDQLAPLGNVYQAGTLSGNPLAVSAGLGVLKYLESHPEIYQKMESLVFDFANEWKKASKLTINRLGSMFTLFHTERPVTNYQEARTQDLEAFKRQFKHYLENGILLPPSAFETAFISKTHQAADLEKLLKYRLL